MLERRECRMKRVSSMLDGTHQHVLSKLAGVTLRILLPLMGRSDASAQGASTDVPVPQGASIVVPNGWAWADTTAESPRHTKVELRRRADIESLFSHGTEIRRDRGYKSTLTEELSRVFAAVLAAV